MIDKDDVCVSIQTFPSFLPLPYRLNLKLCGGDSSIEQMRQISHDESVSAL